MDPRLTSYTLYLSTGFVVDEASLFFYIIIIIIIINQHSKSDRFYISILRVSCCCGVDVFNSGRAKEVFNYYQMSTDKRLKITYAKQ